MKLVRFRAVLFATFGMYQSCLFSEDLSQVEQRIIEHVKTSISNAEEGISKLDQSVLEIAGMSSCKVRHFLNNICSMEKTSYLEIGCWQGSTFVAAVCNNSEALVSAVGIDNWSEFGGAKRGFCINCERFLPVNSYEFYEADSFKFDVKSLVSNPVNVYFYDGNHSVFSHELAFTYYNLILDDLFIAIIDDWNWEAVQKGTKSAFEKLGYHVLYERAMPARWNGDTENWWNGLYIAVIRK